MAIAANFRKYAQALALQLVLPFGAPRWNGSRPSTKLGRAVRAFVTASMKARGTVEYMQPSPVPQWWKDAQQRARDFSIAVRKACRNIDFNELAKHYELESFSQQAPVYIQHQNQHSKIVCHSAQQQ